MTEEELVQIIKRFNEDKIKYNWKETPYLYTKNITLKVLQLYTINFPDYYTFTGPNEFRYWLEHSQEEAFINNWICENCKKLIAKPTFHRCYGYQIGCSKECRYKIARKKTDTTNLIRYGGKAPLQNKEILKKTKKTCLERYGSESVGASKLIQDKVRQTNLKKYGVEYPLQNKNIHDKSIKTGLENGSFKASVVKSKETKLRLYGSINNSKQAGLTKKNWTKEQKEHFIKAVQNTKLKHFNDPNYNNTIQATRTKKENGTLGASISKFEQKWITYLKTTYPQYTILTQYGEDPRYPYNCDCYIKDLDLFIEFQGSYYHNWRPFNDSVEHIEEYNSLMSKGQQKKRIAQRWRYLDTEKRNCALQNHLNYLEYWEKPYTQADLTLPEDPIKRWQIMI